MTQPSALRDEIVKFVLERVEDMAARFFPDFELPAYFAGHKIGEFEGSDLAYTLVGLKKLGVKEVAGQPIERLLVGLLSQVDGPTTTTFYSYRVAETMLALGGLDATLALGREYGIAGGLNRENLLEAIDSTSLFSWETQSIGRWANNYWAVLARCEHFREELGLLPEKTPLPICLEKIVTYLERNSLGFWDDSGELDGRYDSYSADVQLFLEPLWPRLDPALLERNIRAHVRLLESLALENGASVAWGRTIGAHSICMTAEMGALSLRLGYASDPARMLGLVENAFRQFQGWFTDGLINAHRGKMTDGYRGLHRLLQMTIDCLGKLNYVAKELGQVPDLPEPETAPVLFPDRDEVTSFTEDARGGVWMFRNRHLAFQFAYVSGVNSDYVAWPRMPGFLTNPVDCPMFCGVPRVAYGNASFFPAGLPDSVEKVPGGIRVKFSFWRQAGKGYDPVKPIGAIRELELTVEEDTIHGKERWTFEKTPDGIGFDIPEGTAPLAVEVTSSTGHRLGTVELEGIAEWRSAWEVVKRLHQVNVKPAPTVEFTWQVRKAPTVCVYATSSEYTTALYEAMPPRAINWHWHFRRAVLEEPPLERIGKDVQVFHLGWPEHFTIPGGLSEEAFDERWPKYYDALAASGVKIVWTMHNRIPHAAQWHDGRGRRLYEKIAAIADGVIHHSQWGMDLMRAELPFKPGALHTIIEHGHFGEQMRIPHTRAELEAKYGLPPAPIRFGALGRPQPAKQTELIVQAFMDAARPDQQLIVSSHPLKDLDVSGDPRIFLLPREQWMTREEISEHVKLCDALLTAHKGESYLTTGVIGDAIGMGIPLVCNEWGYTRESLGEAGIYHDNTLAGLTRLFAEITPEQIAAGKTATTALQPQYDWRRLAAKTAEFFRQVRNMA